MIISNQLMLSQQIPDGKNKYAIDLDGLASGVYRAVVSAGNNQDSVKFSIGLEAASGQISLVSVKENYSPGESILVLGSTGSVTLD